MTYTYNYILLPWPGAKDGTWLWYHKCGNLQLFQQKKISALLPPVPVQSSRGKPGSCSCRPSPNATRELIPCHPSSPLGAMKVLNYQLTNSRCFGFIWIRFFRILSSKMTRSPPLICWKTSGRALQPSLKPRSSPFSLENKLCEQNQSIKHHIYEDSTSTYIYWHPSKTCSKNALFPSFSCEILTERPAKKVQAVCHGPIGELVENLRRCEYSFARATRMTKWPSNIACKPSNINLHLFGVTSYKASWYSWCGHVQCSEWNTKKYVLCQMIISKNLTLNHTEIHPSVLTLLGSSCPLSLPQTEWQRVEPCEAVMGHGFYENQIGIRDLTQRDISLLRNWNVLQLKSQVLISSPELTH